MKRERQKGRLLYKDKVKSAAVNECISIAINGSGYVTSWRHYNHKHVRYIREKLLSTPVNETLTVDIVTDYRVARHHLQYVRC